MLTISDFFLQHHQLPLPVFCFKNDRYRTRPTSDNLQITAPNSNASQKKYKVQCSSVKIHVTILLFILFPVRHTENFRFDGRHFIDDLLALTMVWKFLYSECDR